MTEFTLLRANNEAVCAYFAFIDTQVRYIRVLYLCKKNNNDEHEIEFCHKIAVFHEGELIQYDDHDSLILNTDGNYYELWNAQAQYYVPTTADA